MASRLREAIKTSYVLVDTMTEHVGVLDLKARQEPLDGCRQQMWSAPPVRSQRLVEQSVVAEDPVAIREIGHGLGGMDDGVEKGRGTTE